MLLSKLIDIYKNKRKQAILDNLNPAYSCKYAFIGVGLHSLSTLYPILTYLNTPIKYVLTQKSSLGNKAALKFPFAKATNNYEEILSDPEVNGIFISSSPASHFELTSKALKYNKHVFVEKPVCFSLEELNKLISINYTNCIVGLQKRYCVINEILKRKYSKPIYYSARYAIGLYPEGDPLYELFIHPIDNLIYLFGRATIVFFKKVKNGKRLTLTIQLEHDSGIFGSLELSTDHTWSNPIDQLRLELPGETILIKYPSYIESISKDPNILGIPLHKVLQSPITRNIIYSNTGIINNLERNILFEGGYFNEVKEFISLVESGKHYINATSSIDKLIDTYELLEFIGLH